MKSVLSTLRIDLRTRLLHLAITGLFVALVSSSALFFRSTPSAAQTPLATLSEDLSADFATLPFHLSFQRLIEIFRSSPNGNGTKLASSVADLQDKLRTLQASMSPADWSKLVEAAPSLVDAENGLDLPGVERDDIATLLRTVKEDTTRTLPSPEKLEEWRQLGERFGGSSWGGESSPDNGERWGGSSR